MLAYILFTHLGSPRTGISDENFETIVNNVFLYYDLKSCLIFKVMIRVDLDMATSRQVKENIYLICCIWEIANVVIRIF